MQENSPPLKPTASGSLKNVDPEIGQMTASFWKKVESLPLFAVYQFIKSEEAKRGALVKIVNKMVRHFYEGTPEVTAMPKTFKG